MTCNDLMTAGFITLIALAIVGQVYGIVRGEIDIAQSKRKGAKDGD